LLQRGLIIGGQNAGLFGLFRKTGRAVPGKLGGKIAQ